MNIVVYRFSAMGDVAMLLPVLRGLLASNNNVEIYLVTRGSFSPLFAGIDRLHIIEADFKGKHKGLGGLAKLVSEIKLAVKKPYLVVDLHNVLRTKVLDLAFRLSGKRVVVFDKGRNAKKRAIKTKSFNGLPHTIERYCKPFLSLGFVFEPYKPPVLNISSTAENNADSFIRKYNSKSTKLAIAPFAKHQQKCWGMDKIEELIRLVNENVDCSVFLLGGGNNEEVQLKELASKFSNCIVAANKLSLDSELALISKMNAVIAMDSANMHFAALTGTPTISIWGATHPALGFSAYAQPESNTIMCANNDKDVKCRPCSVYGNKPCSCGDMRCMTKISAKTVFDILVPYLTRQ